jgi:hypothetical protein
LFVCWVCFRDAMGFERILAGGSFSRCSHRMTTTSWRCEASSRTCRHTCVVSVGPNCVSYALRTMCVVLLVTARTVCYSVSLAGHPCHFHSFRWRCDVLC